MANPELEKLVEEYLLVSKSDTCCSKAFDLALEKTIENFSDVPGGQKVFDFVVGFWGTRKANFLRSTRIIAKAAILNHYSEEEVQQLTEFYRTPLGQATMERGPQVAAEIGVGVQKVLERVIKELLQELETFEE